MKKTHPKPNVHATAAATASASGAGVKALDPKHTFSEEKIRGMVTSIITGGISGGMNFGLTAAGLSPALSAFLGLYITGSLLGYVFDILFAKHEFFIPRGYGGESGPYNGPVPYTDVAARAMWMLHSFAGKHFFRYVITVIIDSLIGIVLLNAAIEYMDSNEFLMDFAFRDAFVAGGISIFTFILYNNILRFDWAYSEADDPLLNVTILMWSTLVLMIFAITFNNNRRGALQGSAGDLTRPPTWWKVNTAGLHTDDDGEQVLRINGEEDDE